VGVLRFINDTRISCFMNDFEELVHDTYKPLIDIGGIVPYHCDSDIILLSHMFDNLDETIIDKTSLQQIEIKELFEATNHTITVTGAATLLRSLMQPPTSLDLILAKQESLREIEADDMLRQSIEDYLQEFKDWNSDSNTKFKEFIDGLRYGKIRGEKALYYLLNGHINFEPRGMYESMRSACKAGAIFGKAIASIKEPESTYLSSLVNDIKNYSNSESYNLMDGKIYKTFRGIKSSRSVKLYEPRLKIPIRAVTAFTALPTILYTAAVVGLMNSIPIDKALGVSGSGLLLPILFTFTAYQIKKILDNKFFVKPFPKKLTSYLEFNNSLDSLGKMDELLSFYKYGKAMPCDMVIPKVTDEEKHRFYSKNLKSPILAKNNPGYVPNDLYLEDTRITFISGPQSSGKTTLVKTIAHTQMLGQIGSNVAASDALMSIADGIFYQYYMPDTLGAEEGDFGVNLLRTKNIFESATPRSLVILNTLASGTTDEESHEQAYDQLNGFYAIGCNTMYVTFKHKLAKQFQEQGRGQFLQGEFAGEKPTFCFIPGISTTGYAQKIAEKHKFTRRHIQDSLKARGYLR